MKEEYGNSINCGMTHTEMAASIGKTTLTNFRTLWSCALPRPTGTLLDNSPVSLLQVRYRNKKQHVKEAKVKGDQKEQFIPKKLRKVAVNVQVENEEKNTILAQSPVDNVWIRKYYPIPTYSVEEAIEKHKTFAQPEMLNNMQGLLFLDMKLDFSTKKKTKFMSSIRSTLRLPHEFPYGSPPNILVLSKTESSINLATSLGAKHVGSPESVLKMIETGVINPKDFEHVLCTGECVKEVLPLRSHFRDRFPQKAKGNLGLDLQAMWDLFYYGYTYESQKVTEAVGRVQVPCGLLEQPTDELVENFTAYITDICQLRSLALGPFIQSIAMVAPPSPEKFMIKVEDYVPGYKDGDVESDEDEEVAL